MYRGSSSSPSISTVLVSLDTDDSKSVPTILNLWCDGKLPVNRSVPPVDAPAAGGTMSQLVIGVYGLSSASDCPSVRNTSSTYTAIAALSEETDIPTAHSVSVWVSIWLPFSSSHPVPP